jgi:hypothetical protein
VWCNPVIPALGSQKQADWEFKASLCYTELKASLFYLGRIYLKNMHRTGAVTTEQCGSITIPNFKLYYKPTISAMPWHRNRYNTKTDI